MKMRISRPYSAVLAFAFVSLCAGGAAAQGTMTPLPPPPPPPPGTPSEPPTAPPPAVAVATPPSEPALTAPPSADPSDAPIPHTGFQMALRAGAAIPLGNAVENTSLSDVLGPQFAMTVDIGAKIVDNIFIGGYLGLGLGGAGGKRADACDKANVSCAGATIRLGIEAQYHISPGAKMNPWVGYGIGIESSGVGQSVGGQTITTTLTGFEFAHFMAGLDFRLSKAVGIGPYVDLSLAQYSSTGVSGGSGSSVSGSIDNKGLHEWLQLGVRGVLFP